MRRGSHSEKKEKCHREKNFLVRRLIQPKHAMNNEFFFLLTILLDLTSTLNLSISIPENLYYEQQGFVVCKTSVNIFHQIIQFEGAHGLLDLI